MMRTLKQGLTNREVKPRGIDMNSQALEAKNQILNESGFIYDYEHEIYFNRDRKKIFSVRFIENRSEKVLEKYAKEPLGFGKWSFHFDVPPSENVMNQITNFLEGRG